MDVSTISQVFSRASAAAPGLEASSNASVDYNAFLQLLIAEMRNQDPTDPMKSSEYMAQFAAFSNVEQGIQMNNKLDALLTATALNQADKLIGRTITSADGEVTGKIASLRIVSGGLVAILEDGKEVFVGEGVEIS